MEYAIIDNKVEHINEVKKGQIGICPVCKTEMIAKKGNVKQYFAHVINTDLDCKAKYNHKITLKKEKEVKMVSKDVYEDFYNNIYNEDVESSSGFTEEQLAIINSKEPRVMVNSVAGSGKTSTVEEYIKRNQDKKILYLVFNRSMRDSASEKFEGIDNVTVSTIHSFAYKKYGSYYRSQLKNNINIFDIAKALKKFIKEPKEFQYMEFLLNEFESFQLSDSKSIKEYCIKNNLNKSVFKDLETIFDKSKKGQMNVTHNQYYKMWHLSDPQFEDYDVLILDESQDINSSMVDILARNTTLQKIIIVGDKNQSLYKFAKCVNAFDLLDNDIWAEYKLTKSFRIGNSLAKMLEHSYKDKIFEDFSIMGMNKHQYLKENIDKNKPYFELCRYNATIVKGAIIKCNGR